MAERLLRKRHDLEDAVKTREGMIDTLRKQHGKLKEQLAEAERACSEFQTQAGQVQGKLALLKAAERVERLREMTKPAGFEATPVSLDGLERDIDRRIQESEQRQAFRENLTPKDDYTQAAKDLNVAAELDALLQAAQQPREGVKK
jgi:phage shock protein A